jgi:hypothetical protein
VFDFERKLIENKYVTVGGNLKTENIKTENFKSTESDSVSILKLLF